MAVTANFSFYRGEDTLITVTMTPITDITGWSLQFTARVTLDILPIAITKTTGHGITLTNPTGGVFTIFLLSADTNTLDPGNYYFDIQRVDSGFHGVLTTGVMTLLDPVAAITPP